MDSEEVCSRPRSGLKSAATLESNINYANQALDEQATSLENTVQSVFCDENLLWNVRVNHSVLISAILATQHLYKAAHRHSTPVRYHGG